MKTINAPTRVYNGPIKTAPSLHLRQQRVGKDSCDGIRGRPYPITVVIQLPDGGGAGAYEEPSLAACHSCGQPVDLQPYPDGGGWNWYECEACGDCRTHKLNLRNDKEEV